MKNNKLENEPSKWSEYSLEFKLMFIYHISAMILFIIGNDLDITIMGSIFILELIIISLISYYNKSKKKWKYFKPKFKNLLIAFLTLIFGALFLYAASIMFPPFKSRSLPWYFAGIGIILFNIFKSLNIVTSSKKEFELQCNVVEYNKKVKEDEENKKNIPLWKKIITSIFYTYFILVWLSFLAFFYYHGKVYTNGSNKKTKEYTVPVNEHGNIKYIKANEEIIRSNLEIISFIGIATVIIIGFISHFILRIEIFTKIKIEKNRQK